MTHIGTTGRATRPSNLVLLVGIALLIFGVRAFLVGKLGSALPFWDQWDLEGNKLYLPYLNGSLPFETLIASHNEHRVTTTRLLALGLLELTGEWNPLTQMLIGAGLLSAFLAGLVAVLGRALTPLSTLLLAGLVACLFIPPIGWENLLQGLGYQFYLEVMFATASLWLLSRAGVFSLGWWGGIALAILAYFSMATGTFVPFAAGLIGVIQLVRGVRTGWREALGAALLFGLGIVMFAFVARVAGHGDFAADSVWQFVNGLARQLSYPLPHLTFLVPLHAPLAILAILVLRRPPPRDNVVWFVLAAAAWIGAGFLSLAYGRAETALSSRYLDSILLMLALDGFACLWLYERFRLRQAAKWLTAAWFVMVVLGLIHVTVSFGLGGTLSRAGITNVEEANVAAYFANPDPALLQVERKLDLPYPDAKRLQRWLDNPQIRGLLVPELVPGQSATDLQSVTDHLLLRGVLATPVRGIFDLLFWLAPAFALIGAGLVGWVGFHRLKMPKPLPEPTA